MGDLPPVERIRALKVEPGETLIVSFPLDYEPSIDEIDFFHEILREALGDVPIVFTLGGAIELTVVKS